MRVGEQLEAGERERALRERISALTPIPEGPTRRPSRGQASKERAQQRGSAGTGTRLVFSRKRRDAEEAGGMSLCH